MNTGQAITLGLQLVGAGLEVMQAVKDAQVKGSDQIDIELDSSLTELAEEINKRKLAAES